MQRWHILAVAFLYLSLTGCGKPPVVESARPAPPAPEEEPIVFPPESLTTPEVDAADVPPVATQEPEPAVIVVPETLTAPVVIDPEKQEPVKPPMVSLPVLDSPLTPEGRKLIYDFEVGGGKPYYDRFLIRPTWPGAASGVTVAIGYDLGYNSRAVILQDWRDLSSAPRLANVAGIKGSSARSRVAEVRDILVKWELAERVYNEVTVTKFWLLCKRTYPGFENLRPNAQAALLSLTFNRGNSLIGDRRREMKEIARLSPKKDYGGMADQIRNMKRIWRGTGIQSGMYRRRDAEARLMES